jgi:peptide chain release factor 1
MNVSRVLSPYCTTMKRPSPASLTETSQDAATTTVGWMFLRVWLLISLLNDDHYFCNGFLLYSKPIFPTTSTATTTLLRLALDEAMLNRLHNINRSHQALTERLGDPDVLNDSKLLQKIMSDRASSEAVVNAYQEYLQLQREWEGAKELFQEAATTSDVELKEMARAEMKELEPQLQTLEDQMKLLLLPQDPNDDRNIMLEIRAGTGGSEASIFAGDLLEVYRKYIASQGWQASLMDQSPGDDGGYKNVVLQVKGDAVYSKMKWEAGVHRVQRVPATESQGRVHTSTATVAIMPECDEVDVQIDAKDIEMSTMRSGGAGGQVRKRTLLVGNNY